MTNIKPIFDFDSYKASHHNAYPSDMQKMVCYLEPRLNDGGNMRMAGVQNFVQNLAENLLTYDDVDLVYKLATQHFGRDDVFPVQDWRYIVDTYGGHLPLKISSLPDGTVFTGSNMVVRVESTDPRVPWLASFVETQIERLWYDITVCTNSYRLREIISKKLSKTCPHWESVLPFMLHDFGARGTSSLQTAAQGGLAHLINFSGSDTFAAITHGYNEYEQMAGYSIPAMEHSTVISWGRERESEAYANFIRENGKPGQPIAIVVDSYDVDYTVQHIIGVELKEMILASGVKLMIRPDSGDPKTMVLKMLGYLESSFGTTTNDRGYKVLNNVGVVQGDGVNAQSIAEILDAIVNDGWCVSNLVFGMGGALLQRVDRDTYRFAYKPCLIVNDLGQAKGVSKSPKDDPGKQSKSGDLDVVYVYGEGLITIDRLTSTLSHPSQLVTHYHNGQLSARDTLDVIRKRG